MRATWLHGRMRRAEGRRAWRLFAALLALFGQITLATASNAEAWRGRDTAAHVEPGGTHAHHAHNEATCVACTTQTLHARPALAFATLPRPTESRGTTSTRERTRYDRTSDYSHGSRAPPA